MRIKVEINGHQFYDEVTGEVLAWGQTVESFDGVAMQVPCVTIDTGSGVKVVSLKSHLKWTNIRKLGDQP